MKGKTMKHKFNKLIFFVMTLGLSPVTGFAEDAGYPCLISPSESVDLGADVTGVLKEILVERSDMVKKDEVVARIGAEVERRSVDLASLRTRDASDVQAAIVEREFAKREKNRIALLYQKSLVSRQELDKAATELELAEKKLEQARAHATEAKRELAVARAQLGRRTIRSPIDGVVAERYLSPGQRVRDEPVVKIIKVDPLHVEVVVPASKYQQIKPGDTMRITPELPGFKARSAKVIITDKVIDAASNTFRVTLEMNNHDLSIPAGARCSAQTGD